MVEQTASFINSFTHSHLREITEYDLEGRITKDIIVTKKRLPSPAMSKL